MATPLSICILNIEEIRQPLNEIQPILLNQMNERMAPLSLSLSKQVAIRAFGI
jgi:hypothetical protein